MIKSFSFCVGQSHQDPSSAERDIYTDAISPSPVGFRVTTSHFSGVVTMICVSATSAFVNCMSPVSSRTRIASHWSRLTNFLTISAANAFIGALDQLQRSISTHMQDLGYYT